MKFNKNFNKIAYILFSLVVAILIGVITYQQHLFKSISKKAEPGALEQVESENNIGASADQYRETDDIKRPSASNTKDLNDLEYQLSASEEELSMTREQLSAELEKQGDLKELQKMIAQTPEVKSGLRNAIKNDFNTLFTPMFTKLGLSGAKLEEFKNLILDYEMAQQDVFSKMQGTNKAEQNEVMENIAKLNDVNDEYQNKIEELFGEEAKDEYMANREKLEELRVASEFSEYLSGTDKMNDEQQEKLVDSLFEARQTQITSMFDEEGNPISPSKNEKERVEDLNIGLMKSYLDSAITILSPSQLEQFKLYINT